MIRRILDIAVAVLVLFACLPVFLLIAAAIRLDSPGNPLYGGWRAGKDGEPFRMWKFRTMVKHADRIGPGITARRDPRITRFGGLLRKTKLDELPQFLNLLLGDLTLIGPRAEVPEIAARYTPAQKEVLSVKPGITGPGQLYYTTDQAAMIPAGVAADDYYVEHLLDKKLAIDIEYLRHRNFGTDLRLILDTMRVMLLALTGRGA